MNDKTNLVERLNAHPELMAHILKLLEISEDSIQNADKIEERTIANVHRLGQQVIQDWADQRETLETQGIQESDTQYEMKGKKNSTGKQPTEK